MADFEARPLFALPFPCNGSWTLTTYHGHDPDDRKVDFFNTGSATEGAPVVASAPGVVTRLLEHGGVKIDHGNGWYTIALHMKDITIRPGEAVDAGTPIGRIGSTDTNVPHLHYEQLFDANSDGRTDDTDIVVPQFEGRSYRLDPDSDSPVLRSRNACD